MIKSEDRRSSPVKKKVAWNKQFLSCKFVLEFYPRSVLYANLLSQRWGTPLSIEEFQKLAKQYASSLQKSNLFPSETPTYDWVRSFLGRHTKLVLKKSKPLEKKRASLTSDQVNNWFQLLSTIIRDHDLENRPGQIFNCDETGENEAHH